MLSGLKTLIGASVAIVATLANLFGYEVSPEFTQQANEIAFEVLAIAGAAYAVYGRLVAEAPGWFAKKPE